jgi:sugar lactone lactonase YvrE
VAQLRRLGEQFVDELIIISVHSGKFISEKSTTNLRQAVLRDGIDQPVVNDADFKMWQQYAVKAWPTLVLIDPRGKIVHTQSGEIVAEEFSPFIEALVSEFDEADLLDRTPLDLQLERTSEPDRPLNYPAKLLLVEESAGAGPTLFVADTRHHRLVEVRLAEGQPHGQIVRVFGSGEAGLRDGPAAEAMFHNPHGLAISGRSLYVADTENHAIRAIDLDNNLVRTVAGTGQKAHGRLRPGSPAETSLRSPWALVADQDMLLIAMAGSHQLWVLLQEEQLGLFAGNGFEALVDGPLLEASFNQPSDIAVGLGHLLVADAEASAIRALSFGEDAKVITLVGQGLFDFGDVDGFGGQVRLQHPTGLAFDDGLLYIADSYNNKIKTLDPTTGEVKSLIGTGQAGYSDGPFEQAELFEPEGVVAGNGFLYIADTNNHSIRLADLKEATIVTLQLAGLIHHG